MHAARLGYGEEPFRDSGAFLGFVPLADLSPHHSRTYSLLSRVIGRFDSLVIKEGKQPIVALREFRGKFSHLRSFAC